MHDILCKQNREQSLLSVFRAHHCYLPTLQAFWRNDWKAWICWTGILRQSNWDTGKTRYCYV